MIIGLLVLNAVALGGFLWIIDRRDKREREQLADLLQRIQAPEVAVTEHAQRHIPPDPPDMPLDDEEMAERMQMIRDIERMENASLS